MTAAEALAAVRRAGFTVTREGATGLRVRPAGLPPELRDALVGHRVPVIALLSGGPPPACPRCGTSLHWLAHGDPAVAWRCSFCAPPARLAEAARWSDGRTRPEAIPPAPSRRCPALTPHVPQDTAPPACRSRCVIS